MPRTSGEKSLGQTVSSSGLASGDIASLSLSGTNTGAAALKCLCPLQPFDVSTPNPPGTSLFPLLSPATNTSGKAISSQLLPSKKKHCISVTECF